MTFHWAANYGAVLQTYALQRSVVALGFDSFVLNYVPWKLVVGRFVQSCRDGDIRGLVRTVRIQAFVMHRIRVRPIFARPHIDRSLKRLSAECVAVITGSDQVWNEWFLLHGPGDSNLAYYLDFVAGECCRIAYATSFGAARLSDEAIGLIRPQLQRFQAISVREFSARSSIWELGFGSTVVADPTLLLRRSDYERLIPDTMGGSGQVFVYMLHEGQERTRLLADEIVARIPGQGRRVLPGNGALAVGEWLGVIRDARYVVTNSYHVVVFCLLFHTPFLALPVDGTLSGMNDRLVTLLGIVGEVDRYSENYHGDLVEALMGNVDWDSVDRALEGFRVSSASFLKEALKSC